MRTIPDWPEDGIMFRDITPLFKDPKALAHRDVLIRHIREFIADGVAAVVMGPSAAMCYVTFELQVMAMSRKGCFASASHPPNQMRLEFFSQLMGANQLADFGGTISAFRLRSSQWTDSATPAETCRT